MKESKSKELWEEKLKAFICWKMNKRKKNFVGKKNKERKMQRIMRRKKKGIQLLKYRKQKKKI